MTDSDRNCEQNEEKIFNCEFSGAELITEAQSGKLPEKFTEENLNVRSTGAIKHDGEKLRFDLIPASAEQALAEVLTHGAKTYSDENWRLGFNWKRVYGATRRHLNQWIDPRQPDTDEAGPTPSHLNHLKHVLCNIAFLIEFIDSHPELDDRFKYGTKE